MEHHVQEVGIEYLETQVTTGTTRKIESVKGKSAGFLGRKVNESGIAL